MFIQGEKNEKIRKFRWPWRGRGRRCSIGFQLLLLGKVPKLHLKDSLLNWQLLENFDMGQALLHIPEQET